MPDITISITDTEQEALEYKIADISAWTDEAVTARAKIAKDEIISQLVAHCNANEIAIASGEDAQVTQAFDLKVVKTAKERDEEASKIVEICHI